MPNAVFVSYTRANDSLYLKQFVDDLTDDLREKLGEGQDANVLFFDQRKIELGSEWATGIAEAVGAAKCVVALASPAFFKSEYCAKEIGLFASRFAGIAGPPPPLIKPVVWVPFDPNTAPTSISQLQYAFGDAQAVHNTKGIKYLLQQFRDRETEYRDLIDALSNDIIASGHRHPIPGLDLPNVRTLVNTNPFWTLAAQQHFEQQMSAPLGPKHVRFVYVAARPRDVDADRQEAYLESGGGDWKPYMPEPTRIHRLLQNLVASDDLDFTSDELSFGANLVEQISSAWTHRQIVVLIVDPWTLDLDARAGATLGYQRILQGLDTSNAYHWSVLIPWNERDDDLDLNRQRIEQTIADTFPFHGGLTRNPMFYRDNIKTSDDLRTAVAEVLARLKEEIKKRAKVVMPVPAGPSKSMIHGPTTERR